MQTEIWNAYTLIEIVRLRIIRKKKGKITSTRQIEHLKLKGTLESEYLENSQDECWHFIVDMYYVLHNEGL